MYLRKVTLGKLWLKKKLKGPGSQGGVFLVVDGVQKT